MSMMTDDAAQTVVSTASNAPTTPIVETIEAAVMRARKELT